MNYRLVAAVSLVIATTLLHSHWLSAQVDRTGAFRGVVVASSSPVQAIPDAKVSLRSRASGSSRETRTDQRGRFRFSLLEPTVYDLQISADGFRPATIRGLQVLVDDEYIEMVVNVALDRN